MPHYDEIIDASEPRSAVDFVVVPLDCHLIDSCLELQTIVMPVDKDLLYGISHSFVTVVLVNCIRIIRLLLLLRHMMVLVEVLLLLRL